MVSEDMWNKQADLRPRPSPRIRGKGALRRESVKKNVAAIHVSGKLSLLQRKLSNVLLLNAYDKLLNQPSHSIDARTLSLMIGYNSNDIDTLKEALKALVETTAEWDMLGDDGGREWGVSTLLASARLRSGICEYSYSPALAEKLHDPKIFSLINLSIQREFSSGHALALYENCYRFVRTGSTGWWDIDLFRGLMGVRDVAYYKVFKQFNAKIIKPAVAEVNAVSNIQVAPEFRRKGRAVAEIRFSIREKTTGPVIEAEAPNASRDALKKRLLGLGVSERLARQWIDDHGAECVVEKLDYVAAQARRGKVRGSPVGYLSAALRDGWTVQSPQRNVRETDGERESRRMEDVEARAAQLRKAHRSACFDAVEALAASRNATQREADLREFRNRIVDPVEREDFRQREWRSSVNARAIFSFWSAISPDALPRIEDIAAEQGEDWEALQAEIAGSREE